MNKKNKTSKINLLLATLSLGSTLAPTIQAVHASSDTSKGDVSNNELEVEEDVLLKIRAVDESSYERLKNLSDSEMNELKSIVNMTDDEVREILTEDEIKQAEIIDENVEEDYIFPEDIEDSEQLEDSQDNDENEDFESEDDLVDQEVKNEDDEVMQEDLIEDDMIEEDGYTTTPEESKPEVKPNDVISKPVSRPKPAPTVKPSLKQNSSAVSSGISKAKRKNTSNVVRNNRSVINKGVGGYVRMDNKESIKFARTPSNQEFINILSEDAVKIARENNLFASVIVAQAALESGFGSSGLASAPNYNMFGIKGSYNGNSVRMNTNEHTSSGQKYQIRAGFKKYPGYKESLEDYASLLANGTTWNKTFYNGAWRTSTNSYEDATRFLTGRYATDVNYDRKLNGIIEAYNLHELDNLESTGSFERIDGVGVGGFLEDEVETIEISHDVKYGDTLYKLSKKYNVEVDDIVLMNNIEDKNLIYVGDVLIIEEEKVVKTSGSTSLIKDIGEEFSKNGSLPVDKDVYSITSKFGERVDPITGDRKSFHYGTDVAKQGISNKEIFSMLSGRVIHTGDKNNGYGNYVVIDHGGFTTLYAHMSKTSEHEIGDEVNAGEVIGFVGSTGRSTGPHVHIELEIDGVKVDPEEYIDLIDVERDKDVTTSSSSVNKSIEGSSKVDRDVGKIHNIIRGDSLSKIALENKVSVKDLKEANNLNSDLIIVGRTLVIPEPKEFAQEDSQGSYKVKGGDTLWDIARLNKTTVNNLKDVNSLKSSLIVIGQILKLA